MSMMSSSGDGCRAPVAIVKEGWLQKRGEHIRNWRDRYFILFDNGDLMGFKSQPEFNNYRDPLNKFTVRDCQLLPVDNSRPFCFQIRGLQCTSAIERSFAVETEQERDAWLTAIRAVSQQLTPSAAPPHDPDIAQLGTSFRDPRRVTLEKFEFLRVLGKGSYGKVVLTREKGTGGLYAMKILKKHVLLKKTQVYNIFTENLVLKKIKHPFLTALRYSFETVDRICFVMEYANGGELFFHLRKERIFPEPRARYYAAEIVCALGYLHSEGIIYRDLKLENIMLDKDGHIKIADFGLCKTDMGWDRTTGTFCGTPEYLAPEVLMEGPHYGPAVDWWSFGVVLYEMCCGRLPFYNHDHSVLYTLIRTETVRFPTHSIKLTAVVRDLLRALLDKDPEVRLGAGPRDAADIMEHNFFADVNWSDLHAKKIPPPFKPLVESETDTRYFDSEFTGESVELTPPEASELTRRPDEFPQFSYQDLASSTHEASLEPPR